MKSSAKLILAALIVTICVALGFGFAGWLEIPTVFVPLFLLPAAFIFALFDRAKFDWIKVALFFLLIGISIWLTQVLVPAPLGDRFVFVGPILLIFFLPFLERLFDRVRRTERHNKARHSSPDGAESK